MRALKRGGQGEGMCSVWGSPEGVITESVAGVRSEVSS